jgi:hypothetical protein
MIKYNFLSNYEGIKIWEKGLDKSPQNKPFFKNDFKEIVLISRAFLIKNKIVYVPTLSTLAVAFMFNLVGFLPFLNALRLETKHQEFTFNVEELTNFNENLENKNKDLEKYYQLYVAGAPAYIFSYFLQKNIPEDVQITEFLIDKDGFNIYAQAYTIKTINEFINSIIEWSIVKSNSITVKNVIKSGNSNQTDPSSNNDLFIVEISGKNNLIGISKRLPIFRDSFNYGKINKIERYINSKESGNIN